MTIRIIELGEGAQFTTRELEVKINGKWEEITIATEALEGFIMDKEEYEETDEKIYFYVPEIEIYWEAKYLTLGNKSNEVRDR